MTKLDLGPTGLSLDIGPGNSHLDRARRSEQLGYRTLWIAGGQLNRLSLVSDILRATSAANVATGIIAPDVYAPAQTAALYAEAVTDAPGRFVAGLGASQSNPRLAALHEYLDALDQAAVPVPASRRILAALGPRKLQLARERFAGAVTLLVTPDHTRAARAILGPDRTLIVDEFVVVETDAERARAVARGPMGFLATVPGYRSNFTRMGFSDDDIATVSDHLVDSLVSWGEVASIADRVAAHRAAGADHVVLSVLSNGSDPLAAAEQLAAL